ncbi:hypothetical protein M5K25_010827 [Dendrobium thyrsiflorum]|uniref:Uncharacterized protein n=1 Tax=Dendrobium thyrsiflorum TaxID=117978 RepID=A0ABD0V7V9_DENTH
MTELKIGEKEEEVDDELIPMETCRVISATLEISAREEYVEEATPESCLMASSMDYSSEVDLYFPNKDDSNLDIASQMDSNKDKGNEIVVNKDIIPTDPKKKDTQNKGIDYNILYHLRKIPAQLNIYNALIMSKNLRETLIQALKNPRRYEVYFIKRCITEVLQARNDLIIIFVEDDMMLETTDHNYPIYRATAS